MTRQMISAALPFLIAFASPLVLLGLIAAKRDYRLTVVLTLGLLSAAFLSIFAAWEKAPIGASELFVIDGFALFYAGLLFAAGLAVSLLAAGSVGGLDDRREEFFPLLCLAVLGGAGLVASRHFASFFLSLETLSVALYALIAYTRDNGRSIEAGLKYLVLAAGSAAFLLFGIALIYFETGTLEFSRLGAALAGPAGLSPVVLAGFALLLVGLGFKLALVPFHVWTPDIYQGSPAPVAALVASVSKGAVAGFMLRFFWATGALAQPSLRLVFSAFAVASMAVGNLLALEQRSIKRLLAYSSIAHFGYLLVAFLAPGTAGVEAVTFYLVAYFIAIAGAFGVVTVMGSGRGEAESIDDYAGLFWRRPRLAGTLSAMLLSLAGIPLTAGFLGKFYAAAAGIGSGQAALVILLVVNSALSLYYYLRVILVMSARPVDGSVVPSKHDRAGVFAPASGIALAVLLLALVWLGLFPSGLIGIIRSAADSLAGFNP